MINKRIMITSVLSIILVSVLFIGNTLSIKTIEKVDPNLNYYNTGSLDITYDTSDSDIILNNSYPLSYDEAMKLTPYRITFHNNGNVDYKFNLVLLDETETTSIDYKYIMIQVGNNEAFSLDSVDNNVILNDIVVKASSDIDIDIFIWLSDDMPNSEIGKGFYAKLNVDGFAVSDSDSDSDNSNLIYEKTQDFIQDNE